MIKLKFSEFKKSVIPFDKHDYITKEEFFKKTNLLNLWDKIEKNHNDIRYKKFGNRDAFILHFYDTFVLGIDNFLFSYYNAVIKFDGVSNNNFYFCAEPIINCNIINKPFLIRYIRNTMNLEMQDCKKNTGASFIVRMKELLIDGKVTGAFSAPSMINKIIDGIPDKKNALISTFKTDIGQMSVFSPKTYKSLLFKTKSLIDTKNKDNSLLCPTASWGTPVIASVDLGYSDVVLVDVQCKVLDKCHLIYDDIFVNKNSLFDDEDYNLGTYCIPSEKMSSVIPRKFDQIFFCPPYYVTELYGGSDVQSTTLYKCYKDWLNGYWLGTVKESCKLLNTGGVFSFVIGEKSNNLELGKDMLEIARKYLSLIDTTNINIGVKNVKFSAKGCTNIEKCYTLIKK